LAPQDFKDFTKVASWQALLLWPLHLAAEPHWLVRHPQKLRTECHDVWH